jgi:hypothetical protein
MPTARDGQGSAQVLVFLRLGVLGGWSRSTDIDDMVDNAVDNRTAGQDLHQLSGTDFSL